MNMTTGPSLRESPSEKRVAQALSESTSEKGRQQVQPGAEEPNGHCAGAGIAFHMSFLWYRFSSYVLPKALLYCLWDFIPPGVIDASSEYLLLVL